MEDYLVKLVVLGLVSWTTIFFLIRKMFSNLSFNSCNRLVSTIHAIFAVSLASISVEDWSCPVCPVAPTPSPWQKSTLAVSLAYFIYDFICCLFDKQLDRANTVHHLVSITGIGAGLINGTCISEMVAALWLTESSSPFLHMRELLKELGYKDSDLNLAADFSFAVTFSCARMIGGPYLTYVVLSSNSPLLMKAMAVGLQLVSAFWFYKIARMVRYKLVKRSGSNKGLNPMSTVN